MADDKRVCLHELPGLTDAERDFVASVTSDPGQASDFTVGFEQLVEALAEARQAVKPLREAVEFLIALACYYCRSGYGGVCKPPCAKCTALDAFRALLDKAGA